MNLRAKLSQRPQAEQIHEIVTYIGGSPARFTELIDLVLEGDKVISQYAAWLISHCMQQNPHLILPHLEALIHNLDKPNLNDSVIRSTVKALAVIGDIPEELQGLALQRCFDYLLNPKIVVSIQVHAMQTVFNISKNEPDLLEELKMVIAERMPHGTAGYKARGRRIIKDIDKVLSAR